MTACSGAPPSPPLSPSSSSLSSAPPASSSSFSFYVTRPSRTQHATKVLVVILQDEGTTIICKGDGEGYYRAKRGTHTWSGRLPSQQQRWAP
ncbi:hypothetical protein AB1Y20_018217 [Prymnesium parvum]|uniref:Uncharacterized protein n=1 Tax=Prymnesium parvum TaxID=97485 RepID=A0AB34JR71_PRYPA